MGAPKTVWLSEDGTGIVSRIQYDPHTNQLVGLLLPINSTTGMPIPYTFRANTYEDIEKFMKFEVSKTVYIVMAQPLKEGVPAFILQIFGTTNCFTAENVTNRQEFTKSGLAK